MLYYPAREPLLSAPRHLDDDEAAALHRKASRRSGLVLDDEVVLEAMEHAAGADPEFLPYKQGKEGRRGDLFDRAQLKLLRRHVERELRRLVDEVAGGDVQPNPYSRGPDAGSCTWCRFEPVCRFAASGGQKRSYAKLQAAEFWQKLEKEAGEDG